MGFGTCLRGRPRRGGKKFRKNHMQHVPVVMQDEFRSSSTCVFCYSPVLQMPSTITTSEGRTRQRKTHGALMCVNPHCPAVVAGYTTFNRDALAATAIGIAAVTTMYSTNGRPLPPFDHKEPSTTRNYALDSQSTLGSSSVHGS